MTPPSRQTTGGRVYLDPRAKARGEGRPTAEFFVLYILERFLLPKTAGMMAAESAPLAKAERGWSGSEL